jgi:hypothetical protein
MMEEKLQKYYSQIQTGATDGLDKGLMPYLTCLAAVQGRKKRKQEKDTHTSYPLSSSNPRFKKHKRRLWENSRTERRPGVGLLDVIAR